MATTPIGRVCPIFSNLAISEPRKECPLPKLLSVEEGDSGKHEIKRTKN